MKKLPAFKFIIIPVLFFLLITGCKKSSNSSLPLLSTTQVSSIDSTTAISGGVIFSDGGDPVTAKGVCWGTSSTEPTINGSKTVDGEGTGTFSSSITGLNKGTLYYVRSYATNLSGTSYGQVLIFTTLSANISNPPPPVTNTILSLDATNITASAATLHGSVPSGSAITDVSFEYGLSGAYGFVSAAVMDPSSSGSLILVNSDISGLMPYTEYHFRVVLNTGGTLTYGDDKVFLTTY